MIKVIAFDYTGVISASGPIRSWLEKNLDKKDKRFLYYKRQSHKWDIGELDLENLYKVLSKLTGVPSDKIWDKFFKEQTLNHDLIDLIKQLKLNYKIILFSNHEAALLKKLLENHKITHLFNELIISSEHKLKKPDPKFYKLLVEKIKINKEEILFIDDSLKNVKAANDFGIKAFQFTNAKNLIRVLKREGVRT